ncbi:ring-cleaving dioxygenase [Baekduia soli]|uniref:Ring-cleaving dioxygenase n=1 Tax=Baekduia soli TaxID=496014 RepID=A0A5B8UAZ4_9ACTN|nr:VOC family protein [Baekduia soli]QEC50230.1 ring-cleaving dioxygenase [Baekduia soli]
MQLHGIHHISAITGDARRNLDFYTRVLGLRLVAKSVNQDDPTVYHLFYADEEGRPGSEMTFFEYPHAIPGRPGAGMVHRIVWRVGSPAALDFWAQRLEALETPVTRTPGAVRFSDPEGLDHELVVPASGDAPLAAEHPDIPARHALQGFEGVRAYAHDPQASGALLERVLGATPAGDATWELRGADRGGWIAYDPAPAERGRQSGGSVHHVAWGTTAAEHLRWQERFEDAGLRTSGIIDRTYFKSIYFREPSGVLFEIADDAPGFTIDDPLPELGRRIILPPQLEPRRAEIEARLTPLPDPRAERAAAAS